MEIDLFEFVEHCRRLAKHALGKHAVEPNKSDQHNFWISERNVSTPSLSNLTLRLNRRNFSVRNVQKCSLSSKISGEVSRLTLFQSDSIALSVGEYGGMKTNSMPSSWARRLGEFRVVRTVVIGHDQNPTDRLQSHSLIMRGTNTDTLLDIDQNVYIIW